MNTRDLELLSSYLDGQLKPSDSARLEARLSSDADLRAVLDDLRAARGLLRQLPMRKAPRNFTLTPKMVGKNPPLPRSYPAFRFVTALASLMLFFTLGLNFVAPQMAQAPAFGMGGGGSPDLYAAQAPAAESVSATEAPLAESAPAEDPSVLMAPQPTGTIASTDNTREIETPADKQGVNGVEDVPQAQPAQAPVPPPVPQSLLMALGVIVVLGASIMVLMRQAAASRWRK